MPLILAPYLFHPCLIFNNNLPCWTHMWNSQLSPAETHKSSSFKKTNDWVPCTYHIAQQERGLGDYSSCMWRSVKRKNKDHEIQSIILFKAHLCQTVLHATLFLFVIITPVRRGIISDEVWMTGKERTIYHDT